VKVVEIAGRKVGRGWPCFIVAEAGVNHNGDIKLAKQLIDEAVQAGVDAIKFQMFKAEGLVTAHAAKAEYQKETTKPAESQLEMLRNLELSSEAHRELHSYCSRYGKLFMSTPFDSESVDILCELGVPVFKVASGEITNWPLLKYIASKGKPIILSTGMSSLGEVDEAVRLVRGEGCDQLVLLHCVSNYPADPADANLRAMHTIESAFEVPVGYSDHTPGIEVALAAVALGACLIEKHFTLDRTLQGPDQRASLEPEELKALVRGVRVVESALGHGRKELRASEVATAHAARRSLVAAKDIPAGTQLTHELINIKRPGTGLPPTMLPYLIGRTLRIAVQADSILRFEMLE